MCRRNGFGQNKHFIKRSNISIGIITHIAQAAFIFAGTVALHSGKPVIVLAHQVESLAVAPRSIVNESSHFQSFGRTAESCYRVTVSDTSFKQKWNIGNIIIIKQDDVTVLLQELGGMRTGEHTRSREARQFGLQLWNSRFIPFGMKAPNGIDTVGILSLDNGFEHKIKRKFRRRFGLHVFIKRYPDLIDCFHK